MSMTRIALIKIHRLFPPENDLGVKIARLCILVEDLMLELKGYLAPKIEVLDTISPEYREIYFLRNLFRTYGELNSTIVRIRMDPDFKGFLEKSNSLDRGKYKELYQNFNEQNEKLKDIRNDIGGHLQEPIIKAGLKRIDRFEEGFLQVSNSGTKSSYIFSQKIIDASVFASYAKDKPGLSQSEFELIRKSFFDAQTSAIPLSGLMFRVYFDGMKLSLTK